MTWLHQFQQSTRLYYQLHIYLASMIASVISLIFASLPSTDASLSTIVVIFLISGVLLLLLFMRAATYNKRLKTIQSIEQTILHSTTYDSRTNTMEYVEKVEHEMKNLRGEQQIKELPYADRLQFTAWHKEKEASQKGELE